MRRFLPFVLAAACTAAGAADLPAHPFVSTAGKAQMWVAPDIAALYFETGAQDGSAGQATASLDELSTANGTLLAEAFGRKLGAAVAIARAPLDKMGPALLDPPGAATPTLPAVQGIKPYTVPPAIPFAQSVTAVFRLAGPSGDATTTRKSAR